MGLDVIATDPGCFDNPALLAQGCADRVADPSPAPSVEAVADRSREGGQLQDNPPSARRTEARE